MLSAEQWTEKLRRGDRPRLARSCRPTSSTRCSAGATREAGRTRWRARRSTSILTNIELAKGNWQPICQDTGTPLVWIHHPVGMSTRMLTAAFEEAVRQATAKQLLRPNAVDPLTDKNTGNGQAPGHPDRALRGVGRAGRSRSA